MEFRSDGTLRGIDLYERPITGTFEFVDSDHVRMKQTVSSEDRKTGSKMVDNSEGLCRVEFKVIRLNLTESGRF